MLVPVPPRPKAPAPDLPTLEAVLAALGGRRNITGVHANSSRLAIGVHDPAAVDEPALGRLVNAVARPTPASVHLIVGPAARSWLAVMETLTVK